MEWITNPIPQNSSSGTNSSTHSQGIPQFYNTQKFITVVHNSQPLSPILSHVKPVHTPPPPNHSSLRSTFILSSNLFQGFSAVSFLQISPLFIHLCSPMRATRPAPLIRHDLINRLPFGEEHSSGISLCSLVQISSSAMHSRTCSAQPMIFPQCQRTSCVHFLRFFTFFYNKERQTFLDGFTAGIPTLITSMRAKFWFVTYVPKYLKPCLIFHTIY
jgi:hypothetical protein